MVGSQITVSTNREILDVKMIHKFLCNESYWAQGITLEAVQHSINHSLCFGIFLDNFQIGFARIITDTVTFGYLCDLFILNKYRGNGYSKILMTHILSHNVVKKLKKLLLITADAHFLYNKFEFKQIINPIKYMELNNSPVESQIE